MTALGKSVRIVLLAGLLAAPSLALAEGTAPTPPKTGDEAGKAKEEEGKKKAGAKSGDKGKEAEGSKDAEKGKEAPKP